MFAKTRGKYGVSGLLVIGYYIVQTAFARQREDASAIDITAMVYAAYSMLAGLYAIVSINKYPVKKAMFSACMENGLWAFFLYHALCALSSIWSSSPMLSLYRAVECIMMFFLIFDAVAYLHLKHENDRCIIRVCSSIFFFITLVQFFSGLYASGVKYAFYKCQFPITIFFILLFFGPNKTSVKAISTIIMLGCKSVTGYLGIVCGIISMAFQNRKYRLFAIAFIVAIFMGIGIYGFDTVVNNTIFEAKGGAMENGKFDEDKTSGRFAIWENAISYINDSERQLYGTGFFVGENTFVKSLIGNQVVGMHNGLMSAYFGCGYPGLVLLFMFLVAIVCNAYKIPRSSAYRAIVIASVFPVIIHTIGNPGIGTRVTGTWIPAMFIAMLVFIERVGTNVCVNNTK